VAGDGLAGTDERFVDGPPLGEAAGQGGDANDEGVVIVRDEDRVAVARQGSSRSSSAVRSAWSRMDFGRPGPMVSFGWAGTVTRPPRCGCRRWMRDPVVRTSAHPPRRRAAIIRRDVSRGKRCPGTFLAHPRR
jgi:hypothetical protein